MKNDTKKPISFCTIKKNKKLDQFLGLEEPEVSEDNAKLHTN